MSHNYSKDELDNHANQCNPNNEAYQGTDDDDDDYEYSQAELDNHANQCNPNNDAYWSSRKQSYHNNRVMGTN